jgi:outer membrane receptor for ferrienterochelin and colicin
MRKLRVLQSLFAVPIAFLALCITCTLLSLLSLAAAPAWATVNGSVRGIVHDPQHRPIAGADVVLQAANSDFSLQTKTNQDGEFRFDVVPIGDYSITVSQSGFQSAAQTITVVSGDVPVLHYELILASTTQSVTVSEEGNPIVPQSATPTSLISREEIIETPGADRANSLALITNYVPGSYYTHDQLHVRGGHQTSWLVDGVPIPNTNIASNIGPQIDPRDIDYLEAQRGSYAADYGDRTYGVFDVAPRTGFERNNEGEVVLTAGNFFQTDDQINFGGHTERFGYYVSFNGNRSDLGLQTPTSDVIHNADNGLGMFGSFIFNANPNNQLRLVTSTRRDYYQIPFAPGDPDSDGLRDAEAETDSYTAFSWLGTLSPGLTLTVSPFYHYNRANYQASPNDFPIAADDNHASTYAGGQATLAYVAGKNNVRVGIYGFGQSDNQTFGLAFNDHSATNFTQAESIDGSLQAIFLEDQFKLTSWLTLNAGVRQTHFSGALVENNTSPRFGIAARVPHLNWTFRAFYGHFYQSPPLITASGPLLNFVTSQNLAFIPLRGERDEESQFGVTIPWKRWALDIDTFKTRATNFFDHNNVGDSNIFFPLTIDGALIRGWELTLHSPRIYKRAEVYVTYSNQIAQGKGAINGGLTDFEPPEGTFLLDHDQRNTLHIGGNITMPWRTYASTDVYYASGFANGDPPPGHLQSHTTFDLSLGKNLGEKWNISATGLNVANRRLLLDNSLTFGGTHFLNPREIYIQIRYKFKY